MNRKALFFVAVLIATLLPLTLVGQEKKDAGSMSVTGCFNKGADADHYVLKDEKLVAQLPVFFRTISGQKPSREDLEKLVELIRSANRP